MTYGHADNVTGAGRPPPSQPPTPPIDPALWTRPDLQLVLTTHDISALFRLLSENGIGQRRIAELIGRSQSRVSEIAHRRAVVSHVVLVEIAAGLGIPPERMGLSWWGPDGRWYGPEDTYPGGVTVTDTAEEVSAEMLRRHLIAWGGIIMTGAPVAKLGELLDDLDTLPPVPPASQLSHTHVVQVRDTVRRLDQSAMILGSNPEMSSTAADLATRLLDLPGAEPTTQALMVAVAQLRLQAGWAAFECGLYHHALYHFARALELATDAEDAYCQALALNYAGLASIEHGHPNDGLKMLQAARVRAWDIPAEPYPGAVVLGEGSRVAVEACGLADSATALAALGESQEAHRQVSTARELWTPARTDAAGDLDRVAARLELHRGRLDIAEHLAAASVRRWEGISPVGRTNSGIILATIHIQAGEPRGLPLAHHAITEVAKLTSVRARRQLVPLAQALETRPGTDARELAQMARQIAA